MVEKIEAYKCDITGAIFEEKQRAIKSEFRAKMKRVGGSLPTMGSINSVEIMIWLASNIENGIYPTVLTQLQDALQYWRENGSL